jgi:hypothetical protein
MTQERTLQRGGLVPMSVSRQRYRRRPQNMIRTAIRQGERADQWADMIRVMPALADLARNLARYLTEFVPAVNAQQPLLVRCLDNGIHAWEAAGQATAQLRFLAFVRGLLYPLPEALEWAVTRPEGDQTSVWNPIDQCLHDWWSGNGDYPEARLRDRPHDSAYVDLNPADFRLIVLVRFLAREPIALTPLSGRLDELVTRYG